MVEIHYRHALTQRVRILRAETRKQGRRLFNYAKSVATDTVRIDLVVNFEIVASFEVE